MISGMLRLKKDKETGSRRVLLRNSNTGKIIMVSSLFTLKDIHMLTILRRISKYTQV